MSSLPSRARPLGLAAPLAVIAVTMVVTAAGAFTPAKLLDLEGFYSSPEHIGWSVAPAGDWNGDGYPDVIVGSHNYDAQTPGYAALYLGGPAPTKVFYRLFTGENDGDGFGYSVAGAGDLNGDGYDDIVVGAPFYDTNEIDAGAVYVFFGGKNADNGYDLKIAPNVSSGYTGVNLGYSVVGAGDQDGDGYDDFLVGAPDAGLGGTWIGKAYIYSGGPSMDATADGYLLGSGQDSFGFCVASGDLNGDGHVDLLVGAPQTYGSVTDPGHVHIYFGGASLPGPTADLVLAGETFPDLFGWSVAAAGDVNGDGYGDVIAGAPNSDADGANAGRAYLYWGGPSMDNLVDLPVPGPVVGGGFGGAVASAGNIDGDQDDEFLVGAPGGASGTVYLFYGGGFVDATPDIVLGSPAGGAQFGESLAGAGDMNGDGLDDFIVGFPGFQSGKGRAIVYAGKSLILKFPKPGQQVYMEAPVQIVWSGDASSQIDYSKDGGQTWSLLVSGVGGGEENSVSLRLPAVQTKHARLRLVAEGESVTLNNSDELRGEFSVVAKFVPPNPVSRRGIAPSGASAGDFLGAAVADAGDVNGDGFPDMIVGAPFDDAGGLNAGRAFIYFGGPGSDPVQDVTMTGEAADDRFGTSVAGAGDVNGDGYDDVIVGAPWNDAAGADAGRAYLFLGGPFMDGIADHVFDGFGATGYFGMSVAGGGDANGDGYPDLLVGEYLAQSSGGNGRAHVFFGGPSMDDNADLTLTGEAQYDSFGYSVAFARDVDGDGFNDVLVGAPGNDAAGDNSGRVYAFSGGPLADDVADMIMTGDHPGDQLGGSVASADVDGDGFSDVLAGAPYCAAGGADAGRVCVFFGGPAMDSIADLTANGAAPGDLFGWSVAGVPDANGDGYDDMVVGAPFNGAGGAQAGRAYLFLGGPGADLQADEVFTGKSADDWLGYSVASLGDRKGDGFADIATGAPDRTGIAANSGVVFLFLMNRYVVTSPIYGDVWNVGAERGVTWEGSVPADLWLSVDGGNRYTRLRQNVGGHETNGVSLTVPHQPTRFAKVKLTPHDETILGQAESDSLFTIQASITLLNLSAQVGAGGGVLLSWNTDPGPEDLAGYAIERSAASREHWELLASMIRETEYRDAGGGPGSHYRLTGINGLGEELVLGETALTPKAALSAWPVPYRGGQLTVSFLTASGLGGRAAPADVSIFDLQGRRVKGLVQGNYDAGTRTAVWDGTDDSGRPVSSGVYFVRAVTAGESTRIKLVVTR